MEPHKNTSEDKSYNNNPVYSPLENKGIRARGQGKAHGVFGFALLCTCIKVTSLILYVLKCVQVSLCETAGFVLVVPAAYRAGETPGEY